MVRGGRAEMTSAMRLRDFGRWVMVKFGGLRGFAERPKEASNVRRRWLDSRLLGGRGERRGARWIGGMNWGAPRHYGRSCGPMELFIGHGTLGGLEGSIGRVSDAIDVSVAVELKPGLGKADATEDARLT
ncbi:MAG: hypothetical protein ACTS6P_00665 [Candidatus Hodgkinia cicadicola]